MCLSKRYCIETHSKFISKLNSNVQTWTEKLNILDITPDKDLMGLKHCCVSHPIKLWELHSSVQMLSLVLPYWICYTVFDLTIGWDVHTTTFLHILWEDLDNMSDVDIQTANRRHKDRKKAIPIRLHCTTGNVMLQTCQTCRRVSVWKMYFTLKHTDFIWTSNPLPHLREETFKSFFTPCMCGTCIVLE